MCTPTSSKTATNAYASYSLPLSEWNISGCGWIRSADHNAWMVSGAPLRRRRGHHSSGEKIDDRRYVYPHAMMREFREIRRPHVLRECRHGEGEQVRVPDGDSLLLRHLRPLRR